MASVGPGPVTRTFMHGGYRVSVRIEPNRAAVPNAFSVKVERDGQPIQDAEVVAKFTMLDMEMTSQAYRLEQRQPAVYARSSVPSLVMVGRWAVSFSIAPRGDRPFDVLLLDHAQG
jgi:hypothetical protein